MGVQLRYMPLHELQRLEVVISKAFEPEAFKSLESHNTALGDLVSAPFCGRRVRGQ